KSFVGNDAFYCRGYIFLVLNKEVLCFYHIRDIFYSCLFNDLFDKDIKALIDIADGIIGRIDMDEDEFEVCTIKFYGLFEHIYLAIFEIAEKTYLFYAELFFLERYGQYWKFGVKEHIVHVGAGDEGI